jgi:hypothetical protein
MIMSQYDISEATAIWREKGRINKERRDKNKELIEEYDRTVYRPAREALIARCEKNGHVKGEFHDNGFGHCWYYCNQCGGRMDIEKY